MACFVSAGALFVNILMDLRDDTFTIVRAVGYSLVGIILIWAGMDAL